MTQLTVYTAPLLLPVGRVGLPISVSASSPRPTSNAGDGVSSCLGSQSNVGRILVGPSMAFKLVTTFVFVKPFAFRPL
ncbi:hypothetical protein R1flu_010682 [Riccia fluitans]|uniref:Secreted protein n=1 Tax=Riccia fluitans TaxID=41844 RepID=A0ABD1Z5P0_9MARC